MIECSHPESGIHDTIFFILYLDGCAIECGETFFVLWKVFYEKGIGCFGKYVDG